MAWVRAYDSTGRLFQVCRQDAGMSCVAASAAMAFYYLRGRRAPEMLGRWAIEVARNVREGGDAFAFRNWEQHGTMEDEVQDALRQLNIRSTVHTAGQYFMTTRCSPQAPALCRTEIHFNGQAYGHCVLCVGAVPAGGGVPNRIVILDPERGLQEVASAALPQYHPTRFGVGLFTGPCWLCRT
jgi:hypothetical protein